MQAAGHPTVSTRKLSLNGECATLDRKHSMTRHKDAAKGRTRQPAAAVVETCLRSAANISLYSMVVPAYLLGGLLLACLQICLCLGTQKGQDRSVSGFLDLASISPDQLLPNLPKQLHCRESIPADGRNSRPRSCQHDPWGGACRGGWRWVGRGGGGGRSLALIAWFCSHTSKAHMFDSAAASSVTSIS